MYAWIESHGIVVGLLSGAIGWCWRIDSRVSVLMDRVKWISEHGCALGCECRFTEKRHKH